MIFIFDSGGVITGKSSLVQYAFCFVALCTSIFDEIKANKNLKSIMVITKPYNNDKIYSIKPVSSKNVEPQKIQEQKTSTTNINTSKPIEKNNIDMQKLNQLSLI